jgi:uncharacterized protein YyaL (SSP411 family)
MRSQTTQHEAQKHTNRLINESSPYLLKHAHNPVDWFAWSEDAFEKAKREDKPILLSIGYSSCHWCSVFERESFENEAIAQLMNDLFVCIKVDREERPDLDTIYMNAVQMMIWHGGWPLTVFLTPDGAPFYGGTYFPPEDRHGMPGFPRILFGVADAYRNRRDEIEQSASSVLQALRQLGETEAGEGELSAAILDQATNDLLRRHDPVYGGFSHQGPKFPPAMSLEFLLRQWLRTKNESALRAVELTLNRMAQGGMYDQLGGGFHRYSVDEKWLVPHFEKMLYDNALLARLYADAFLVTDNQFYKRIATETLDYVVREMTAPGGGFYSSQDADSEGVEGKFFVWTPEETEALLGEQDAKLFNRYFDVSQFGNFEHGASILHVDDDAEIIARLMQAPPERMNEVIARGRQILLEARERRIKPARDEKILTAWNGLMLRSFAEAARSFDRDDYLAVAVKNAEFVLANLRRDGRLLRTHKDGESKLNGYLEDYAFLADGLLALYETTFELRWFTQARALTETMIEQFYDMAQGGFYFTSNDHETLITRTKDLMDNATPSGNSVAVAVLLRLGLLTGEERYQQIADRTLQMLQDSILQYPTAFGRLLCALDFRLSSPHEIAVIGERNASDTKALLAALAAHYLPNKVVACAAPNDEQATQTIKLLAARPQIGAQATAYVCHQYRCEAPVTDPAALLAQLK